LEERRPIKPLGDRIRTVLSPSPLPLKTAAARSA
jgi:hypothetical protein